MIKNKAKCKLCGTVIESIYRHDFVECKCGAIAVDGGNDYFRRIGDQKNFILFDENDNEIIKTESYVDKFPILNMGK